MKTTKILNTECEPLKISSLPTRPTAPTAYGGRGFTSREMKEAFDKLPLLIIERFNSLLDDISADREESILSVLATGLREGHTLADLIDDVKNGNFSAYLTLSGESLATVIEGIRYDIDRLVSDFERSGLSEIFELDCGSAKERLAYSSGKENTDV